MRAAKIGWGKSCIKFLHFISSRDPAGWKSVDIHYQFTEVIAPLHSRGNQCLILARAAVLCLGPVISHEL